MKGITIDVGNTAIKTAYFESGKLLDFKRDSITDLPLQIAEAIDFEYDYVALCSVKPSVVSMVKENFPQIKIVDSSDYDQMIKMYLGNPPKFGSYAELGVDIAVGCYGALADGDSNVIVVDSGTATTVTAVVDSVIEAVYIYPGFRLSKQSLFGGAEALEGDYRLKIREGRAANTEACIDLAVYHGTNGAVQEIINQIEKMYFRTFKVYITGGDASEFYIDAYKCDDKLVNIGLERYIRSISK